MGFFDPLEVLTIYSLKEAIETQVVVGICKNRWDRLSGGKPIVASWSVYENISQAGLMEIWNQFVEWVTEDNGKGLKREWLFSTEVDLMPVWVIDDKVCYTMMYPWDN